MGEDVPLAGHSQKSVRQDAEHSRRDADAPKELPVGKMCGAPEGIEEGLGAFGGPVAKSFVPGLGPADVILVGGGCSGTAVRGQPVICFSLVAVYFVIVGGDTS